MGPADEETDEDLVERARRGNAAAYEALVQRYTETAFRAACLVTGSAADAEEAAQDAFVKAHRALGRFHVGAAFRPWLLRIVGNEARNRRRAAGRRASLELRLAANVETGPPPISPEAAVLAGEQHEALLAAVMSLPDEYRDVVIGRHLLQLSVAETSSMLDLPEGTVKSRLSRALDRLRTVLGEARDG